MKYALTLLAAMAAVSCQPAHATGVHQPAPTQHQSQGQGQGQGQHQSSEAVSNSNSSGYGAGGSLDYASKNLYLSVGGFTPAGPSAYSSGNLCKTYTQNVHPKFSILFGAFNWDGGADTTDKYDSECMELAARLERVNFKANQANLRLNMDEPIHPPAKAATKAPKRPAKARSAKRWGQGTTNPCQKAYDTAANCISRGFVPKQDFLSDEAL